MLGKVARTFTDSLTFSDFLYSSVSVLVLVFVIFLVFLIICGKLTVGLLAFERTIGLKNIHCVSKTFPPLNSLQLCKTLADFQKFCTAGKRIKFVTKPTQHYSPHLRHVATLPLDIENFRKYSADMENAKKLHF